MSRIGEEQREIYVEPVELPEPLRTPQAEPVTPTPQPEPVSVPVEV